MRRHEQIRALAGRDEHGLSMHGIFLQPAVAAGEMEFRYVRSEACNDRSLVPPD